MPKRGRGSDDDDPVAQLVVRPAAVCAAVLDEVCTWRDKCNSLYDVDSKMSVGKDSIVLQCGFFEELTCAQMLSLTRAKLPGDYAVQSVSCDLNKQVVKYTIARCAGKRAREDLRPPAAVLPGGGGESEALRLRTVFDVKEADATAVQAALRAATASFASPSDWRLARCAPRPAHYVLHVAVVGGAVPDEALRIAAEYHGMVDFENKQLVFTVEKKQSEIV